MNYKYEIYVPTSYVKDNGVVKFSNINFYINDMIESLGLKDVYIREENKNGETVNVISFFTDMQIDLTDTMNKVKSDLHQQTIFVTRSDITSMTF